MRRKVEQITWMLVWVLITTAAIRWWNPTTSAQGLTTCGQAAVIGPDQSITIYPWVTAGPMTAAFNPTQANGGMPTPVHAPSEVVLALPDEVPVCVKRKDGTMCTTVGVILAAARKK